MVEAVEIAATNFVSLGGVWLDELRWSDRPAIKDVVGGSATYATLGARLFAQGNPSNVALLINAGHDFPDGVLNQLRTWGTRIHVMRHTDLPSTRGILEYGTDPSRPTFTRTTPPLLTSPSDIANAGFLDSTAFHLFATPSIARDQLSQLTALREANKDLRHRRQPIVVWEPHPKSCSRDSLEEHLTFCQESTVTVFSPNHVELAAFFPRTYGAGGFNRWAIEAQAQMFLMHAEDTSATELTSTAEETSAVKGTSTTEALNRTEASNATERTSVTQKHGGVQAVVVRAAQHGCMIVTRARRDPIWLPAYFGTAEQDKVVDPTGAGNAFLGGLVMGWHETGDWAESACYGAVAAGFAVQQIGVPVVGGTGEDETWAKSVVRARLDEYKAREQVKEALDGV